ncbi:MAG: hypothetical protein OEN56_05545 [Gemmatimonadota bacterium]|nr:hypothetical protein [Gemmatimonadota bacterium]MDH3424446.1 hypothetical protein [Gemmatimonadota bacterium]
MAEVTRKIGLSLGADICWPVAYTEILNKLDLAIPWGGDTVRFEVDRLRIDPFDLEEHVPHHVVIDRLTHWYNPRREWIKKAILLDDVYVFNNPWSVQSMEKLTTYCAMIRLGFPIPRTWLIPPKEYDAWEPDLRHTLQHYARYFDLEQIGEKVGYPLFMKPYDGGGWRAVSRIDNADELKKAYEESGTSVMHLQEAIHGFDRFVRCIGLGPQTRLVLYDLDAPLHDRYTMTQNFVDDDESRLIRDMTLVINAFFAWDFNSCEVIHKDGVWYPIDFANPCPDSQVTSLHYHFPWMILANIRWSVFAATTLRKQLPMKWPRYFQAVEEGMTMRERLDAMMPIVHRRFATERFEEFCATHLSHLDEVANEWFGTADCRDAVRQKVAALFPAHEVEQYTETFFERIQNWCAREGAFTT